MTTYQNIQMKLAGSRTGRVTLHLICLCQDGKLRWHARGIGREMPTWQQLVAPLSRQQTRRVQSSLDASALANGVAAIHDTIFLKRNTRTAA